MVNESILGVWSEVDAGVRSYHRMDLSSQHLSRHWRRCSRSADLWSHYTALFIGPTPPPGHLNRDAATHVISYLLNELFENGAKFSDSPEQTMRYECWVRDDDIVFRMTNHITPSQLDRFSAIIHDLLESDAEELYFRRIEEAAESGDAGSGLGYLTLIKDYGVQFGFRFSPIGSESVTAEVQARLGLEET